MNEELTKLIYENENLIYSFMKGYSNYVDKEDLYQVGVIGLINAYNNSIHTILTSASILSLVTLVVGYFGSAIASKICITISQGTIMSTLLILFILPALIASFDKFITRKK